jgi:hypothetical protein
LPVVGNQEMPHRPPKSHYSSFKVDIKAQYFKLVSDLSGNQKVKEGLEFLFDMGFRDFEANMKILSEANSDIQVATDLILDTQRLKNIFVEDNHPYCLN